jgi:antitoxin component YwqK of YwqJK toxin-antitoxin module
MKKIPFYIIILTFYGCQNNSAEILPCNLQVDNGITYSNGIKYSGTCNMFYNDTLLWKTRTYKKGKQTNETSYYIPEGTLEYVGSEKNGLIDGDFISYYRNGEISIEGEVDMGKYVGEWKYYDDDGSLNKTLYYNKKGEKIDSIMHKL